MLLALSGYELHLKNYSSQNHNYNVAKQVLFDKNVPRSLHYALNRAHKYLSDISTANPIEGSETLCKLFGRTYSIVQYADLDTLAQDGFENYLLQIRKQLNEFGRKLGQIYFSYS